jgi:hypothetical protein
VAGLLFSTVRTRKELVGVFGGKADTAEPQESLR